MPATNGSVLATLVSPRTSGKAMSRFGHLQQFEHRLLHAWFNYLFCSTSYPVFLPKCCVYCCRLPTSLRTSMISTTNPQLTRDLVNWPPCTFGQTTAAPNLNAGIFEVNIQDCPFKLMAFGAVNMPTFHQMHTCLYVSTWVSASTATDAFLHFQVLQCLGLWVSEICWTRLHFL